MRVVSVEHKTLVRPPMKTSASILDIGMWTSEKKL